MSINMKKSPIKKFKQRPQFDVAYLEEARQDKNSCIDLRTKKLHICLHPSQLKDFHSSVKDTLNKRLTKYSKDFDGILLGYDKITVVSSGGSIISDSCFIHFDVEGDFYVFKPFVGQKLKGIVNKTSKAHLGCLVYNIFNVAIPKPDDDDDWLGYQAQIGHEILFQIVDTNLDRRLPYIKGELLDILSEIENDTSTKQNTVIKFTDEDEEEETKSPKKKKKKRKSKDNEETGKKKKRKREEIESDDDIEELTVKKKKKKKKSHVDEDVSIDRSLMSTEEEDLQQSVVETPTKHKKKKRKSE